MTCDLIRKNIGNPGQEHHIQETYPEKGTKSRKKSVHSRDYSYPLCTTEGLGRPPDEDSCAHPAQAAPLCTSLFQMFVEVAEDGGLFAFAAVVATIKEFGTERS